MGVREGSANVNKSLKRAVAFTAFGVVLGVTLEKCSTYVKTAFRTRPIYNAYERYQTTCSRDCRFAVGTLGKSIYIIERSNVTGGTLSASEPLFDSDRRLLVVPDHGAIALKDGSSYLFTKEGEILEIDLISGINRVSLKKGWK